MRFARLARKFEGLQFGHRFLSNWMNCLRVIVQSVLKDFYLEDSIQASGCYQLKKNMLHSTMDHLLKMLKTRFEKQSHM